MTLTAAILLKAYRDCLRSGFRPEYLLECSDDEGGLCQYPVRNSKAITKAFAEQLPDHEDGFYYTFNTKSDPV